MAAMEGLGPALSQIGFVQTLLDSLDTATAPPRVMLASFVSARPAAQAALLLAHVLIHPRCPEAARLDMGRYSEALVQLAGVRARPLLWPPAVARAVPCCACFLMLRRSARERKRRAGTALRLQWVGLHAAERLRCCPSGMPPPSLWSPPSPASLQACSDADAVRVLEPITGALSRAIASLPA